MLMRDLCCAVALLTLAAPSRGQVAVRMPPGQKLPTDVPKDENNNLLFSYLACKGCRPVDLPDAKAAPVPFLRDGKPAAVEFMEPFFAVGEPYQSGGTKYRLLARADRDASKLVDYVGWVDARYLAGSEALKDKDTLIHHKAITVTRPRGAKGEKVSGVPVYLAPDLNAEQASPVSLLQLYFIYADTHPEDPDKGFALLGRGAVLASPRDTGLMLGWVPKSRVCRWFTREAFDFHESRRPAPAEVYLKPNDAYDAWTGHSRKVRPIFRERPPADGKPLRPLPADQMRFLLLPWPDATAEDRAARARYEKLPGGDGREPVPLHHVGMYGGFRSSVTDEEVMSSDEVERLKRKLSQLKDEATRVQVLFVIDDTASMVPYFKPVADVFGEVLKQLRSDRRVVDAAVTYYNDVTSRGTDPYAAVKSSPLRDFRTHGPAVAAELARHAAADGGDPPEQVLRGLRKGIVDAEFAQKARKLVFLLGDMGHNTTFDTDKWPSPTEGQIARQLNPAGQSPIEFYAVQMVDPDAPFDFASEKLSAQDFRRRAKKILDESELILSKDKSLKHRTAGRYFHFAPARLDEMRKVLLDGFKKLDDEAALIARQIDELSVGRFTAEVGPELLRMLEAEGVDIGKLRALKGAQVFETGYLPARTQQGAPQVAERLLVSEGQINEVIEGLKKLASRDPARRTLKELIPKLIEAQAGETIADALFPQARGLTFRSDFLRSPARRFRANQASENERAVLLKKLMMLEDLVAGVRYERYAESRESVAGVELKRYRREGEALRLDGSKPDRMRRYFHLGGDKTSRWYWIDFEKEWP